MPYKGVLMLARVSWRRARYHQSGKSGFEAELGEAVLQLRLTKDSIKT